MKIYYQNTLKTADLTVTNLISGEAAEDLLQQDLERTITCNAPAALITAVWSIETIRVADTLFISNTNALQGTIRLYDQNQVLVQTIAVALDRRNNKIEFSPVAVGKLELTLEASGENLTVGLVFLDLGITLPRFVVGVDMSDEIRGTGDRSDGGQTNGINGVTLETFTASWARITEGERALMRRYINDVQFSGNHYISPYAGMDVYMAIADAGKFTKHDGNGFYWDTTIKYMEAK